MEKRVIANLVDPLLRTPEPTQAFRCFELDLMTTLGFFLLCVALMILSVVGGRNE